MKKIKQFCFSCSYDVTRIVFGIDAALVINYKSLSTNDTRINESRRTRMLVYKCGSHQFLLLDVQYVSQRTHTQRNFREV